ISTGERTLINENKDRLQRMVFDNADKLRMAVRSAPNGDTELLRINADGTSTKIYDCNSFEECSPIRFHKDDKRVYIRTNKGDPDLIELALLDVATGKVEKVEGDPMKRVDLAAAAFSDRTNELVATYYEDGKVRIDWKDKQFRSDYELIKKRLGDRDISFGSRTSDESKFIVATFSDVDPGTVWLYDRKTKGL